MNGHEAASESRIWRLKVDAMFHMNKKTDYTELPSEQFVSY